MMIKAIVVAVVASVAASAAYAKCGGKDKLLFACSTAKGKQIEVCNFGQTIRYSYGKPSAKAEIVINAPRETVSGISSHGSGRYITNAVAIPNGDAIYQVSWSADKLQESDKLTGGVEAIINGKSIFVACRSEPLVGNVEGIRFEEESAQ